MDRVWLRMPASETYPDIVERTITGYWQPWVDELGSEYHANGTYLGQFPTGNGFGCWWDTDEGVYGAVDENGESSGDHEPSMHLPTHWAPMEPPEFP